MKYIILLILCYIIIVASQSIQVSSVQKISNLDGNLNVTLAPADWFGWSVANIGDVNNDDVMDIAIGAYGDDTSGWNTGAIYVSFMNHDGTVNSTQKICSTEGNLGVTLASGDFFGRSVAGNSDLDQDSIPDIFVGANGPCCIT
jgi:hypothetical protein